MNAFGALRETVRVVVTRLPEPNPELSPVRPGSGVRPPNSGGGATHPLLWLGLRFPLWNDVHLLHGMVARKGVVERRHHQTIHTPNCSFQRSSTPSP